MISRSDRILSLARKKNVSNPSCDQPHFTHSPAAGSGGTNKLTNINQTVATNINKIWILTIIIFDYNNEYQNSQKLVKSKDISDLKDALLQKESKNVEITEDFLICSETLPCFDEDDEMQ